MKKYAKFIAMMLTIALLATCFAGCSKPAASSSGATSSSATSSEAATSSAATSSQAAASAVERIKKAGKLTVLTNAAWAPFEYLDNDGKIAGVDVDICQAVADELGVELDMQDMDFDFIVQYVQTGKGDLGAAGMTAREDRKKMVDFSINYVDTGLYILVGINNDAIKTGDDLAGKSIGVQLGTTSDLFASEIEGATVQRYKTAPDAVAQLANGAIDAVVVDELPAKDAVSNNATTIKMLDEPLTVEQYAIAIAKEDTDLKEVVDKVLQKMLDDGTVEQLIAKHMELSAQVGK